MDAEIVDSQDKLALRNPGVPATLNDLAALRGEGVEIVEARVVVLQTMRRAAIRMTSPEDWLLFKSPDEQGGQITGYLQDCGADRVRDLYGIEIFDISQPEKVSGDAPGVFHYLIQGSGRCKVTKQILESVEGGRSSTDDFCRGKSGIELELAVRKAARANLDGNITRELAGLKSVPLSEIDEAWSGTSKDSKNCRRGRGFGTASERLGARKESAPDVDPPTCPHCPAVNGMPVQLKYREGRDGRGAFYGCPNYQQHPNKKITIDAAKWIAEQQQKQPAAPTPEPTPAPAKGEPPSADDIFGGGSKRG